MKDALIVIGLFILWILINTGLAILIGILFPMPTP